MFDGVLILAVCIAFALILLRSIRHVRRRRELDEAAEDFLFSNGVSSMAELQAKVEASREEHGYSGPPTGMKDVSNFAEGRMSSGR